MKLAIITPTRNRLYTLSLLHKYISAQTRKPNLWIIATDGKAPEISREPIEILVTQTEYAGSPVKSFTGNLTRAVNLAEENGADAVLIMEDDDWYAPEYVEKMEQTFGRGEIIGNKPARSMNIVSGSMKDAQHNYIVLAQLGFTRSENDLFRAAVEQCLKEDSCGVDKAFSLLAREKSISRESLQSPQLYFGLKGIYDIGSKQSQGITEQHRRHKKYLKDPLTHLLYLLSKSKKTAMNRSCMKSYSTKLVKMTRQVTAILSPVQSKVSGGISDGQIHEITIGSCLKSCFLSRIIHEQGEKSGSKAKANCRLPHAWVRGHHHKYFCRDRDGRQLAEGFAFR